ncbi:hypothetical protein MERGE_001499 [Pneumocystis wakefieldiae]|uniref:Ribosomal eL28/Mak16 domain-containing protein n=1 Tax=Pneumocystis wakefieldiae TaxID=38082 RepID=A0A899FT95_9ASCO|nr:hypothetical protein MERGE_001499 [Pneumocystis wakefieldiae]
MASLRDKSRLKRPDFYESLSGDLVWACLKKNASFLVKQRVGKPVVFSKERLNLVNIHSYAYSGLLNDKGLGLESGTNNKGLLLLIKNSSLACRNKPSSLIHKVYYAPKSYCYTIRRIEKLLAKKQYPQKLQRVSRASSRRLDT